MPNSSSVVFLQLAISTFAWTYLLLTLTKVLTDQKTLTFILISTALLASTPQIIQHDTVILSTSITNSFLLILLTSLIRILYSKQFTFGSFATLILIAALLMIQKSTFIPIVVTFVFLALYSKRHQAGLFKKLTVSSLILISVVYSLIVGNNVNSHWQVSYSGQTLLWQLGGQSPVAVEFAAHLKEKGVPLCVFSEAPYQNLDTSIGKILNDCPEGAEFLKTGIQKEFVSFLVSSPRAAVDLIVLGAGASSTNSASNYGGAVSVVPDFFSNLFFGTTSPNITESNVQDQVEGMNLINSGKPFWIFAPIFGWLLLASLGFFFQRNRNRDESILYIALLLTLLQSALVVVLLPSEWARQTSPYTTGIFVLCIFLTAKTMAVIFGSKPMHDS
jgi:4-amino-4-deoxy-L-arabinose transferase-like glycosyltransferase